MAGRIRPALRTFRLIPPSSSYKRYDKVVSDMKAQRQRLSGDDGATMVEYALMVALIAVVCIAAVTLIGRNANSKFSTVGNSISASS